MSSNALESLHALQLLRERFDVPEARPLLDRLIWETESAVVRATKSGTSSYASRNGLQRKDVAATAPPGGHTG